MSKLTSDDVVKSLTESMMSIQSQLETEREENKK